MSYSEKLSHGLSIDLIVLDGEYCGKYRTRIEEVGQKIITVGAPYDKGEVVPLREGTKVVITFWDHLSAYEFEGEIMQRIAVPVPMLVLKFPDSITKVQRRNYVRVPAAFDLSFKVVKEDGLSDLLRGTMVDFSGGGVRFITDEPVENKALLYVQLGLPNGEIQTPARVCRTETMEKNQRYTVTAEFFDLSERERDQIIKCVFERQREMRKKGLI
ncbi:putative glycosyltransferase [Desulfosporosinus acidiphilus SJ4]|uniref:Putative glycosyltransferase n=1 Tax=Desulfosporosinus acidiphilus (strain DSM 22704 / JCM 16185 / SJ4) TaxID=646529 RepID=I4DA66_DESAJ|nr:flagellar brake domain-containing protein [Desulfosporosinus acidiphilus]AFM42690.1 putative glycosyltransferase [Desulfosporosinus acidiphilus SJ4]